MAFERKIWDRLHQLPADKQQELLNFAESLLAKVEKKTITWLPGFFDEVVGAWKREPLVRAPQGGVDERDLWP